MCHKFGKQVPKVREASAPMKRNIKGRLKGLEEQAQANGKIKEGVSK